MGRAAARKAARRPASARGSCATPGCPLMATKRVNGAWVCGKHGHQVAHGLRMAKLEQEGNELIMEANAEAFGYERQRGRPVLIG
jgi:hypothetical protein